MLFVDATVSDAIVCFNMRHETAGGLDALDCEKGRYACF